MQITVVSGPPCAGKSTHIAEHRDPEHSIVVDLDNLAVALGYPAPHLDPRGDHHPARRAAYLARASLLKRALAHQLDVAEVWIIDSQPTPDSRRKYDAAGATLVTIDPGPDACYQRSADRPAGTHDVITAWYGTTPPSRTW